MTCVLELSGSPSAPTSSKKYPPLCRAVREKREYRGLGTV